MSRARADIEDDDPITLETASKVVLRGAVTVSTLRAEAKRGNLAVEKIGKNLFTTRAYIKQMRDRCRVQVDRPGLTSEATAGGRSGSPEDATGEIASLEAAIQALIKRPRQK